MYYGLFLDESGKDHNSPYTALCGYVASIDEWARFDLEWRNRQLKWGVPTIHMSRIMASDDGDRDDWSNLRKKMTTAWPDFRDKVLNEFAELVAQSNVACVGAVVDATAYQQIRKEDPKDFLLTKVDSNVFLLQNVLMNALDMVDRVDKGGFVTINIDDDREHAFEYYKSYWNLKELINNPVLPSEMKYRFTRITHRVDMIAFCNDTYHPAIQAADMISYVARRYKVDESKGIDDEGGELYTLLTRGGTGQVKWFPKEMLFKIAGNTARHSRELDEAGNKESAS